MVPLQYNTMLPLLGTGILMLTHYVYLLIISIINSSCLVNFNESAA